jgi:hypothetical protein
MAMVAVKGTGRADDPWILKTPSGTSEYKMHRDETSDPPSLVCVVGTTKLRYRRGVGPLTEQPGERLVRAEKGPPRAICSVRPALDGSAGKSKGRAQREGQQDAGALTSSEAPPGFAGRPSARSPENDPRYGGKK